MHAYEYMGQHSLQSDIINRASSKSWHVNSYEFHPEEQLQSPIGE
jgi:hypothetical protein